MSVQKAQPRDGSVRQSLTHAKSLLKEALQLIDAHADAPELGARLQEVIDAVDAKLKGAGRPGR